MAATSLRAYQNQLDDLLQQERFEEVIAHARHILKSFPKNLRAYGQLGRALQAEGRWEEAVGVLRRALGAAPGEFDTHSILAQCYQQLGQADRAIWHAERALDQKPGDSATTGLIRELYREHRGEQIERMQLTAGALAQQQIRNNLLHAALDTLAEALERRPNRIDLQLLRARTLWLDGQRMDAAESAVDILERLPYAIDANRIMTELWLAEQRPSDAQVYLRRIEDLNPYLAHQLASGEPGPDDLRTLETLDYSAISQREQTIVNPEWLQNLGDESAADGDGDESGGLGALFGLEDAAPADATGDVTAGLDDLLTEDEVEALFRELVTGETVAAVSAWQDDHGASVAALEEPGSLTEAPSAEEIDAQLDSDIAESTQNDAMEDFVAQLSELEDEDAEPAADMNLGLDDEMANLLEELDAADDSNDWMAAIQAPGGDDEGALEYVDDFDGEHLQAPEQEAGAPWLSAAMREAAGESDDPFDLFADDDQLQSLLKGATDTEPIHQADIDDWLGREAAPAADAGDDLALDLDDEELRAPPAASWLDDGEADAPRSIFDTASDDDPNQLNAELIDSWQAELDDDDDDPYVDWLSEDPDLLQDELNALAAADAPAERPGPAPATDTARAWGLDDPDQLADFVDEAERAGAGPADWMNAVVPGLDRERDADADDPDEFAGPIAPPGRDFAWVSDIVKEETGEMPAIDPAPAGDIAYFRFSKPPAWFSALQAEVTGGNGGAVAALSVDEGLSALDLDELTFDDYFNFDTPTDKMDVINLDDETDRVSFQGIDWDDYFDVESPTEKTIAITLDESAAVDFDALGVDDDDFEFETPSDSRAAADNDPLNFDDLDLPGAGAGPRAPSADADDRPSWLGLEGLGDDFEADDRDRDSGRSSL